MCECPVVGWCPILGYSLPCACSLQERHWTTMVLYRTSGWMDDKESHSLLCVNICLGLISEEQKTSLFNTEFGFCTKNRWCVCLGPTTQSSDVPEEDFQLWKSAPSFAKCERSSSWALCRVHIKCERSSSSIKPRYVCCVWSDILFHFIWRLFVNVRVYLLLLMKVPASIV